MNGRRFSVGSMVKILGVANIFRVTGYHQNIYFAQGRTIIYNRYQLTDIHTDRDYPDYVSEDNLEPAQTLKITRKEFDILLDEYNDYIKLYDEFKDEEDKYKALSLINTFKLYKVVNE